MMHGITSLKVLDPNRGNTAKATDGSATFAEDLCGEEERKLKASFLPPHFFSSSFSSSRCLARCRCARSPLRCIVKGTGPVARSERDHGWAGGVPAEQVCRKSGVGD